MSKPERNAQPDSPAADAPRADADWNMTPPARRGGHETRIALLLVVCLVGAVGFVIHRKLEERKSGVQSADFQRPAPHSGAASAGSQSAEPQEPGGESFEPWSVAQHEPDAGDGLAHANHQPRAESWNDLPAGESGVSAPHEVDRGGDTGLFVMTGHTAGDVNAEQRQATRAEDEWNPFAAHPGADPAEGGDASGSDARSVVDGRVQATPPTFAESSEPLDTPEGDSTWSSDVHDSPLQPTADVAGTSAEFDPLAAASTGHAAGPGEHTSSSAPFELFGSEPESDAAAYDSRDVAESVELSGPLLEPVPIASPDAAPLPTGNASEGLTVEATAGESRPAADNPWEQAPVDTRTTGDTPPPVEFDFSASPANPIQTTGGQQGEAGFFFETDSPPQTSGGWDSPAAGESPASARPPDPFVQAPTTTGIPVGGSGGVPVHTVHSGENFWTIARQHYGAGRYANALAAYNQQRIPDPRKLRPGMKVLVPDAQLLSQQYPRLTGAAYGPGTGPAAQRPGFFVDSNGQPAYRVGRHDTLSDIAARCLGRSSRWVQVFGMNRDQLKDANSLKTGMVLRLPADATQVGVVSGEAIAR